LSSYTYPSSSIVDKVTFRKSDNGSLRAYLSADDNATHEDILKAANAMCDEGWYVIHSMCDGKPALEVRGYLREGAVRDVLKNKGLVTGEGQLEPDAEDKRSFIDKMRARTLQGTSAFFLAADASFAKYGYMESHPEDVAAGLSYAVGSFTMGLAGTNAQAMTEIKKQTKKLLEHIKEHENDIDLSKSLTIPVVTENNKRDVFHKALDVLQSYPAEIGNSFTALAGALIAYGAYKYKVKPEHLSAGHSRTAGYMDVGLGMSTIASGMIGSLIKEKKHDPDQPRAEGLAGLWEWVQERPLSIAAFGYMCSTACHTVSTVIEYNKAKKVGDIKTRDAVKWRAGFIGCTIIGEILLMLSSKGHGEGVKSDASTEDSIISIAAEIIAHQKPALQAHLIDDIGTFLGRPDVLGGQDADLKKRLAAMVESFKNNPWIQAVEEAQAKERPAVEPAGAWQAKMAAQPETPHHLGA